MAYPGGKGGMGVAQALINLMPPHDVYVEPFLGGAAVMKAKRPARLNVGLDRSRTVVETAIVDFRDLAAPEPAILPAPSPSSALAAGNCKIDDADRRTSPQFTMRRVDALEWLASPARLFTPQTLIYCDPPYVRSARRGSRDLYEFEMADEDHTRLLNILKTLNCMVMISGYWSELYAAALAGWNTITYQTTVRSGALVTEWVWFNYPRPVALHDYRYLGKGFRERERIKRKMKRWRARLERMPELERQALLWAMTGNA